MQFNNTFELINHILIKKDILDFLVCPTTYGLEVSCYPNLDFPDYQILEIRISQIDTDLSEEQNLGTGRTYKFSRRNDKVFGEIICKMEYSDYFNANKKSLQNELKTKIVQILAAELKCDESVFHNKYDCQLYFKTLEDKFELSILDWDNELEQEIPLELENKLKTEMVKFTKQQSTNTFEFDCHYEFTFTNDNDVVYEFWETNLDLNLLIDGQQYEY
jgi:hypothetical protein